LDDYRSENERRTVESVLSQISGSVNFFRVKHQLTLEILRQRQLDRLPPNQAWNYAGEGNVITGISNSVADGRMTNPNTNRSEHSNELSVKDRIIISDTTSLWAGLRHVAFKKESSQNAPIYGTNPSKLDGHITLPWLAVSNVFENKQFFVSHGHGLEQNVTPNSWTLYKNAGEVLGVSRSRQTELGVRNESKGLSNWAYTYFEISKPLAHDVLDTTIAYPASTRYLDGIQKHKGLEFNGDHSFDRWNLSTSARWMNTAIAEVKTAPETVGSSPLNVPKFVLRGTAQYRYASLPGLRTGLSVSHEGQRNVTEDGNVKLPAWTTLGAVAHYDKKINSTPTTFTLAIDNLEDKRYWRESPKQFGHYYLYPGAPRTIRATVQFSL
jgi:iron complex outermembrane receptor protein